MGLMGFFYFHCRLYKKKKKKGKEKFFFFFVFLFVCTLFDEWSVSKSMINSSHEIRLHFGR